MQSKTVTFPGRVLHLSEDQEPLKAQLYGHEKLTYDPARTRLGGHFGALSVAKTGGQRVLGSLTYEETSPGFEANDLGFQVRADNRSLSAALRVRNPFQNAWSREWGVAVFQTVGANFAGDRTEQRTTVFAEATLLNFQELTYILSASPATLNDRLLRGGPMATRPGGALQNLRWSSDPRRPRVYGLELSRATDASGRQSAGVAVDLEWRPTPALRVRMGPVWQGGRATDQYVQAVADPLATATSARMVDDLFAELKTLEVKDLGTVHKFLGMRVQFQENGSLWTKKCFCANI